MARIRMSRRTHEIPDEWRDAIAEELEHLGDEASAEAARRLRDESSGEGASLRDETGALKLALQRGIAGAALRMGDGDPCVLRLSDDISQDLEELPHDENR